MPHPGVVRFHAAAALLAQQPNEGGVMFRNRSFLVRMVKDENEVTVDNGPPVDHTKLVDTITRNAIGVIVIYFGADTVRQVLVHVAKTAIQPD